MVHGSAVSLFRRRYKGLMRPMTLKSRVRASGKSSSSKEGREGVKGWMDWEWVVLDRVK